MRRKLAVGGIYRAMLFLLGGVLVGLGWRVGLLFSITALIIFLGQFSTILYSHLRYAKIYSEDRVPHETSRLL
jgi:hypothetical protein